MYLKGVAEQGTTLLTDLKTEAGAAVFCLRVSVMGLKYLFRLASTCVCMYPRFESVQLHTEELARTNSRVQAEMVRRIGPNVRTFKSDFNITGLFGFVSVDCSP